MFGLTLVDHLRLTFGHVIYSHRAHAQLAARYSRWRRSLLVAEALLLLLVVVSAVALLATGQLAYAVVTAAAAGVAVAVVLVRVLVDLDARVAAHRTCSARLWHIRERYRALLSDLQDGAMSLDQARDRRDALMRVLEEVYEHAPPADRTAYESARREVPADHEAVLSDEEVDRFLPPSLQKAGKSAA